MRATPQVHCSSISSRLRSLTVTDVTTMSYFLCYPSSEWMGNNTLTPWLALLVFNRTFVLVVVGGAETSTLPENLTSNGVEGWACVFHWESVELNNWTAWYQECFTDCPLKFQNGGPCPLVTRLGILDSFLKKPFFLPQLYSVPMWLPLFVFLYLNRDFLCLFSPHWIAGQSLTQSFTSNCLSISTNV